MGSIGSLGLNPTLISRGVPIQSSDSFSIDAFGRWRTSEPQTLFDSKNIFDDTDIAGTLENLPLYFDNSEVSGGGTSTSYRHDEASQRLSVSATTAGLRARKSRQSFNYQPGKSQQIYVTFNMISQDEGVSKRCGYFSALDGIFLEDTGTSYQIVTRTSTSGSAVDNAVDQSDWNIDKMDGTGVSGITIDFTKTQILVIDFEWLGVGRVRTGFVIDGLFYYVHKFLNANNLTIVYMQTPNLPICYEIENDGTGVASNFDCICCSVISEGGTDDLGQVRYAGSATACNADVAGTVYAIIGMRLKSNYIGQQIKVLDVSLSEITTADELQWFMIYNPTVAGTFTYADETNSAIQIARGDTANTVTGGTTIGGGFFNSGNRGGTSSADLDNALSLGSAIDGTVDEIVLCCTPLPGSSNTDVFGGISWRELT